ncbi:MAG TPA: invasion associated locus B family protein [Tabrizicola sp.]|nr:invasion associated locus B family protein [Tabrizicola sp.]
MAKIQTTALALLFALAAPLAAQTTEDPAPETAPEEAAPVTTTEEGLSMGVPAEGEGIGKPYIAAKFEAWEQRCLRTELSADPCELYYLLKDEQGASVAEFSIYGLPSGGSGPAVAGANFMAPLETLLTAGISMQIDGGTPKAYPFSVCSGAGCMARMGFTPEELAAMKAGNEVTFLLVPFIAPDAKVTLKMSLKGFTAGMDATDAANAAADAAAAEAAASGTEDGGEAAPSP